jgi:2-polyprenyl-3-methyl-5-hydroxy-6-metoxy-1,4-benzoquinol methylase
LSVFDWVVHEIFKKSGYDVREISEIDDFCVAFRGDLLDILTQDQDLCDLPRARGNARLSFGVAKGIYTHRYGNIFESGRADLMAYVPLDAREVLDIGSAKGLFGELLKKRQKCTVTGVDIDNEMIKIASGRLDSVISGDIEDLLDKGALEKYDCILCGDVLEHLNNPWKVVGALKKHLRKGGLFIASTPNVMNWAVIFEQIRGRWEYVPASILSGTHIRFFTKQCLEELFIDAGYEIKEVSLQSFELPPQGLAFIESLRSLGNDLNEEELKASEIVIVASSG